MATDEPIFPQRVIEACTLTHREDLSLEWVIGRLENPDCTCEALHHLNMGRANIHCVPFPFKHEWPVQLFYISLFVLIILLSCAGNLAVVWIVLRHERMRTVTNYYLLNLAVSDLSIAILNTGFSGSYNLYYNWIFSASHCAFNNLMGITPICASVFTMMVMSVDRYLAVVYPLRARPGRGKTVSIIACIWLLAVLCGLPAMFTSHIESNFFVDPMSSGEVFQDRVCLADNFPDGDSQTSILFSVYNHSLVIMQYLIPLLILSFTYGRVAYVLRQNNAIGDTRHYESVRAKRRASNMLALVVFTFIFMWMPYNLYFLFLQNYLQDYFVDAKTSLYLYINIYCIGMSSCLMNPVIYYHMNERFRCGFRYAFRWLPCIRIRREDYETAFSGGSRLSCPTPGFSAANTIFSSATMQHKKSSVSMHPHPHPHTHQPHHHHHNSIAL